jgi:hypothetical protein
MAAAVTTPAIDPSALKQAAKDAKHAHVTAQTAAAAARNAWHSAALAFGLELPTAARPRFNAPSAKVGAAPTLEEMTKLLSATADANAKELAAEKAHTAAQAALQSWLQG